MAESKTPKKTPAKKAGRKVPAKKEEPVKKVRKVKEFERPSARDVVDFINLRVGNTGPVIRSAGDSWNVFDLRRPCGILALDLNTGGGLPAGGLSQLDGPESVGKNMLMYHHMAQIQKLYGHNACVAMACLEMPLDKRFAQMCGVRIAMSAYDIDVENRSREKRHEPPMTIDEVREAREIPTVGEFLILDQGGAEAILEGTLELVKSNRCQLIGLDSWDSILTIKEQTTAMGDVPQVASPANLQTQFMKKLCDDALRPIYRCADCGGAPLKKEVVSYDTRNYRYACEYCGWKGLDPEVEVNESTILAIRQVRAKINLMGKSFGRKYQTGGAHARRHGNLVRISLHAGKVIREGGEKGPAIGKEVNWEIPKGKTGAKEKGAGAISLFYQPLRYDIHNDLIKTCLELGVIERSGAFLDIPCLDTKIRGKNNLLTLLEEDPGVISALREAAYIAFGLDHVRFS